MQERFAAPKELIRWRESATSLVYWRLGRPPT